MGSVLVSGTLIVRTIGLICLGQLLSGVVKHLRDECMNPVLQRREGRADVLHILPVVVVRAQGAGILLCDAFFVTGVLVLCVAQLLRAIAHAGDRQLHLGMRAPQFFHVAIRVLLRIHACGILSS